MGEQVVEGWGGRTFQPLGPGADRPEGANDLLERPLALPDLDGFEETVHLSLVHAKLGRYAGRPEQADVRIRVWMGERVRSDHQGRHRVRAEVELVQTVACLRCPH